jgi:hypothetical protein
MVVVSYNLRGSISQALSGLHCVPLPEQAPQPCFNREHAILPPHLSSSVRPYDNPAPSTIQVPQSQNRNAGTMERREKKNWCTLCQMEFSQSQGLSRHIKDKHKDKESCLYCSSFKWSPGRPYIYRNHLRMRHPQSPSMKFDRGIQKDLRKLEALGVEHQSSPKYQPLTSLFFSLSP